MNAACSCAEISLLLFPGLPLTVLDDVLVATVHALPPAPTLPPDPPECMARYGQYLKDKYKRMSTLPDGDWPPSLGRQYTRLALIEQERELPGAELVATMEKDYIHGNIDNIVKRKKAIQLPEIFLPPEDGGQQLKILMDGAPGVGKSTLSRKICKDWASGQLLQQYHLVILLPLRQPSIREATSIEGLIEADDPDLKHQVVRHIQRTSGEHVLLIVDGYDELSYDDRTKNSLFLGLIQEKKFPKFSVLVTSRPYASDYLQQLQSINRHVEVLGFTEEQIKHCIMENIPDKAKATELVQSLKERQDIASLCYIPLNCAIVLHVYKMAQCTLPHSLTKLYEAFLVNALKRHAKVIGNDPRSTRRLNSLKNLPEPLQQQLSTLSMLAYNGLLADKMVFSTDDLEAVFPDCSDLNIDSYLLGLMTAFKEFTSTDEELSYQFLHLTIQEFLAARWAASQLSGGELLKFFQDHLQEEQYRMVLLFLAGISQLKFPSAEDLLRDRLNFKNSHLSGYSNRKIVDHFLFLAHLIYESQNFSLFRNLAGTIAGAELFAAWYCIAPFDCLVLAHFLVWCDCSLKSLDLRGCGLTNQFHEIMHRVSLQHHGTTQIEELCLSYNPKIIEKLSLLSQLPMFERTRVLIACGLQYPEQVSYNQLHLHCLLNMRHLTTLEVSVNKNPNVDSVIYLSLNKFQCQHVNIDSENAVHIFRSLEHNTILEELDLSRNRQLADDDGEAVGCAIEKMLNVNRTLKVLNLSGCNITDPIVEHILTGLTNNTSLVALNMRSPKLSVSCAVSLFQQMTTHPTLTITVGEVNVLGVGRVKMDSETIWCAIGDLIPENCVEFFRALNNSGLKVPDWNVQHLTDQTAEHFAVRVAECQSVQALKLKHCNISSAGAVSIFRSLEHNTSLEELDLSGNSQLAKGDSEAVGCAIERMLNVNRTLKVLNLYGCGLTNELASYFANGLTQKHSVRQVILHSNNIGSTGAVSIFRSLEHNTSLEELDLSGNSQLAEGDNEAVGCAIERMLNVNRTLKVLNLYGCELTNEVASYFANGLAQNHSVRKMILCSNNIGRTGAVSIFRSLEHNTSLEELDLSGNSQLAEGDNEAVGCGIERMLNVNRTLKVLNLAECRLTSEVVSYFANGLAQNHSVRKVILHSNNIGSTGAVSIFRSLEHNTSLEELDLSGNQQLAEGDSEAVGCAIERMLKINRTLKVLNLRGCKVTDPIVKHVVTGLTKNMSLVTLAVGSSSKLSSKCAVSLLHQVTTHPTLRTVGQMNVLGVGEIGMDSGTIWCVVGHTVPENCVDFFRALNDSGMKVLKLNVQDLTNQTAEHFAVGLAESQSVQALKLKHCYITSAGAVTIFRSLEHNTSLEELDLSGNSQLAEGDSEAVGCAIERMLNVNRTLKVLNLAECRLTSEVVSYFANGLAQNHSVRKVTLHSNNIGSTAAVSIFRSLEHNTTLEELDLSGNSQLAEGDSEAVGCTIERMLNMNRTLKVLNLNDCRLGITVVTHIAAALAHSTSLTEVNIGRNTVSRNIITSEKWIHLFKALCNNTSLKKLDISRNKLGMEGSVALAEMLSCNKSLTELYLSECDLPEAGLREIARGLLQNTTLQTLTLWSPPQKTFLEAEIERLKKSGNITPQSSSRLEIK